jgi:hypothetical protein
MVICKSQDVTTMLLTWLYVRVRETGKIVTPIKHIYMVVHWLGTDTSIIMAGLK